MPDEETRADSGAQTRTERKPTRRRFLKTTLALGGLAGVGGALAFFRTRGYELAPEREGKLASLSPWQFIVVEHAARRIAAPDGGEGKVPSADDVDVAGFVDAYAAEMPDPLRSDLGKLLVYLEHVAPIGSGYVSRFSRLSPKEQDEVLSAMEASSIDDLRGGFAALKSLVFMGYYRDARTWKILGYEGPLVGRPRGGWER